MRYERTDRFVSDYRRLAAAEQRMFRDAARLFNEACDDRAGAPGLLDWPASLRVKAVRGARGVFEMTWSFTGPDGRATWEWTQVRDADGRMQPAVRWRRIGGHEIFKSP